MNKLATLAIVTLSALALSAPVEARPRGRRGGPQAGQGQGGQGGQGGARRGKRGKRGKKGRRGPQRPSPHGVFQRLDADKDGKISAAEARAAGAQRAAQIMAADADNDGFVTPAELRTYLQAQAVTKTFQRFDKNSDGFIDQTEMGRAKARLIQADADGDGKVSVAELTAFIQANAAKAQARAAVGRAFKAADANNDGKLVAGEWPANAAATHAAVDANNDGEVTGREIGAYMKANNGTSPF